MIVQHLMGLSAVTEITAVITAAGVAGFRLWVSFRQSAMAEHARTLRMVAALYGDTGQDRAKLIRACADLEAAIGTAVNCQAESTRRSRGNRTV